MENINSQKHSSSSSCRTNTHTTTSESLKRDIAKKVIVLRQVDSFNRGNAGENVRANQTHDNLFAHTSLNFQVSFYS